MHACRSHGYMDIKQTKINIGINGQYCTCVPSNLQLMAVLLEKLSNAHEVFNGGNVIHYRMLKEKQKGKPGPA